MITAILCWLGFHKYDEDVWLNEPMITSTNYTCERCGDSWGATTIGPFNFRIPIDEEKS